MLIAVAGNVVAGIGIAASPVSLAFDSIYGGVLVVGALGPAVGGYLRYRASDPARAPLWGLAYAASMAVLLIALFGTAILIRPTVRGIPWLDDAWAGIILGGCLAALPSALLWEREARRRRFAALALLALWLILGGIFAKVSGDSWAPLGVLLFLGGIGVLLLAFEGDRRSVRRNPAQPDTWR